MSKQRSTYISQPFSSKGKRSRCVAIIVIFAILVLLAAFFAQERNDTLVVAIDPGHSASAEGAYANGVSEQETNWAIANAAVAELNTYDNVRAVLTRTYDQDMSNEERTISASEQGASVVVSIHCDYSLSGGVRGCLAIVPNDSEYRYEECHVEGTRLASCILDELVAIGVESRGICTRDSDIEDYYPRLAGVTDFYGMNYHPRMHGMLGIIIEHGVLSNYDEAVMLATDEWRTELGIADATGIAQYYGLKKASRP